MAGAGQFFRVNWSVFAENYQSDGDASSILEFDSFESHAEVAQLVEHDLAKVGVAGSSPVFRSESTCGRRSRSRDRPLRSRRD